ncbi:MAG TPA: carboxypeptidase-like regulatory domain-containing protein [Pyrinomonadaceae bacterium]|nr:carboxypeptidase-like regulatory domain-containing protein [Pyrinomonadaceae bacterium]
MKNRRLYLFLSVFAAALFLLTTATVSFAQANGGFSGTVTDPQSATVSGVTVTIRNTATNQTRTTQTTEDGRYAFQVLSVGTYEATFEQAGFQKLVFPDIQVEAAVTRTIDVGLTVGEATATVNVTDTAPLITPETSTTTRQITGEEITRVPTSTRSFTQLTTAAAGVSAELSPVATNSNGNISPSVNGTRTTATSLYFNGDKPLF